MKRKNILDTLMTDREPLEYIEHSNICIKDGFLMAISVNGIYNIPSSGVMMLLMGPGTSITHEAIIRCSENGLNIAVVRGKLNIHAYFFAGRWPDPQKNRTQVLSTESYSKRTTIAKILISNLYKKAGIAIPDRLSSTESMYEIMGYESALFKKLYNKYSTKYNIDNFSRNYESKEKINLSISMLSKFLYSCATGVILTYGLNPSIGIIHGKKRRGALAFDLADQFKEKFVIDLAMKNKRKGSKELIFLFNELAKKEKLISKMFGFCEWLIDGAREEECHRWS